MGNILANTGIIGAAQAARNASDSDLGWLIEETLKRMPSLISPWTLLDGLSKILDRVVSFAQNEPGRSALDRVAVQLPSLIGQIGFESLLTVTSKITRALVRALLKTGPLATIFDNNPTVDFIWGQRSTVARFIVDLFECTKCYIPATSESGAKGDPMKGRALRKYNELDLAEPMNRHAFISQIQRLAKSIIFILSGGVPTGAPIAQVVISTETTLTTDATALVVEGPPDIDEAAREAGHSRRTSVGEALPAALETTGEGPRPSISTEETTAPRDARENETWLFVNGIAGEYYWLRLACRKLAAHFNRKVEGVFNRGDGILWDLIECAGERTARESGSTRSQDHLIGRTESSYRAQQALRERLKGALEDTKARDVVVVAHSQGCLILRLALEELVTDPASDDLRAIMEKRLFVFTFASPSVHWNVEKAGPHAGNHLQTYTKWTEHFANRADFVAGLGVLGKQGGEGRTGADRGYPDDRVFVNEDTAWEGHLFGAQYTLDPERYTGAHNRTGLESWLLTSGGKSIDKDKRLWGR